MADKHNTSQIDGNEINGYDDEYENEDDYYDQEEEQEQVPIQNHRKNMLIFKDHTIN